MSPFDFLLSPEQQAGLDRYARGWGTDSISPVSRGRGVTPAQPGRGLQDLFPRDHSIDDTFYSDNQHHADPAIREEERRRMQAFLNHMLGKR